MPSDRKHYSSQGAGHGSARGPSASGGRGGRPSDRRGTGALGPWRRSRADLIVWIVLFVVAVGTIIAAFTVPLPGQKDAAAAAPAGQTVLMASTLTNSSIVASMAPVTLDSQSVPHLAHTRALITVNRS
jgi:hypothetical protein